MKNGERLPSKTAQPVRNNNKPTYIGFLVILYIPVVTSLVALSGCTGFTVVFEPKNCIKDMPSAKSATMTGKNPSLFQGEGISSAIGSHLSSSHIKIAVSSIYTGGGILSLNMYHCNNHNLMLLVSWFRELLITSWMK